MAASFSVALSEQIDTRYKVNVIAQVQFIKWTVIFDHANISILSCNAFRLWAHT